MDMYAYYAVDEGMILQRAGEILAECFDAEEIVAKVAEEAGSRRVWWSS